MLVNARGVQHKLLAGGYCVDSIYTAVKTINRYKKARRACAVRAFRTSSDDSGNHRWRILVELAGVEPAPVILYLVEI